MPSSSPWHVLVIGNGNYDEAIGALPGAIEDAEKFAKEVPQRLGDDQPIVLLNGSADEHYRRIDDWLQAESSKKMMFCAGHGMRCQGIFYIKTTKNEDIPVQEYVRRKVDHLGKRDVVVACFFGTCQVHTESSGNLQNPHFPGLSAKHHFTGLNNLFAFSFNSEPGKYVVDYSNVYARVLIDMLSCGGYRSLQEVLETLPDLVSNESSFTDRPWKEDNLGNSSASFGEDTEDSSDLSEPSALCALSPQSLSGDSGVQIIPSSQTKPAPDQLMTLTGDMTILHRADSVIGECMWKLDRVDFKGCNSHARDATLQRAAQYSVELCKAMHDLRFLVLPGTTDSQIYPTLPKRLTLLQKYVQGLDLVLRNGQLKWHGWHSFSAEIHRVFDDQSAAAVYENLITYASTLYHCQLRRIVVEQAGLDHEILLEIEQCLRVAAEGFVAQSREILPGPISKHQVFVALHSWGCSTEMVGQTLRMPSYISWLVWAAPCSGNGRDSRSLEGSAIWGAKIPTVATVAKTRHWSSHLLRRCGFVPLQSNTMVWRVVARGIVSRFHIAHGVEWVANMATSRLAALHSSEGVSAQFRQFTPQGSCEELFAAVHSLGQDFTETTAPEKRDLSEDFCFAWVGYGVSSPEVCSRSWSSHACCAKMIFWYVLVQAIALNPVNLRLVWMLSNSYDLCGCMVSCKRSLWINKIRVAILLSAEFRRSIVATFSMEFCTKEFHLPRSNNTQQSRHPQPPGAPKDDATAATAATLRSYAQLHRRPIRPVVHPVVRSPREVSPRLQGQLGRLKQQLHVLRSEAKMLRKNLTDNESLGCANSVFDRQR